MGLAARLRLALVIGRGMWDTWRQGAGMALLVDPAGVGDAGAAPKLPARASLAKDRKGP